MGLKPSEESKQIVEELLEVMHACGSNFTNTFRKLAQKDLEKQNLIQSLLIESLPTDYFKRSLRIIANPNISKEEIDMICQHDSGFNRYFLT